MGAARTIRIGLVIVAACGGFAVAAPSSAARPPAAPASAAPASAAPASAAPATAAPPTATPAAAASWTTGFLGNPANTDAQRGRFHAISCGAPGDCVAVGRYSGTDGTRPVLHRLVDGHEVSTIEAPVPRVVQRFYEAELTAVSCWAAGACVAVGYYFDERTHHRGMIETLRNGTWHAERSPTPPGVVDYRLDSVACNAASCVVTGTDLGYDAAATVLLTRPRGGSWTLQSVTGPETAPAVSNPACPPSGTCYALANGRMLAFPASGGGWKAVYLAPPRRAQPHSASLLGLSCPRPRTCVGIGSYRGVGTRLARPFQETLRQGVLHAGRLPVPATRPALSREWFGGVSCWALTGCAAFVHNYDDSTKLLYRLAGTTWTAQDQPGGFAAQGVACSARGACAIAGNSYDLDTLPVATYTGGAWTVQQLAIPQTTPAVEYAYLISIACSGSICVAGGEGAAGQGYSWELDAVGTRIPSA